MMGRGEPNVGVSALCKGKYRGRPESANDNALLQQLPWTWASLGHSSNPRLSAPAVSRLIVRSSSNALIKAIVGLKNMMKFVWNSREEKMDLFAGSAYICMLLLSQPSSAVD